jgi:hypothetical protein
MMQTRIIAALAATALAGAAVVGCGGTKSSSPSSSSSSSTSKSAAPIDYATLLIKETDLPGNEPFTRSQPTVSPGGQPGVTAQFQNQAGTRVIGDTILILSDAAAAQGALKASVGSLGSNVNGTPQSAAVGDGGTIVAGNAPDGSKAVTILLFSSGKAFVTMEYDSAPDDAVPPDAVVDLGQKQDAAIKKGLGS